jgi:thiamine pyrophosphate-dependent acetolactate synthase large subunit-like protein
MCIGLAKALPDRTIVGIPGDGDVLMQLAGLPSLGRENPENLVIIVNDNENYQTGGDHPTMTGFDTDLEELASASGVEYTETVHTYSGFETEMERALENSADHARFIVVKTEAESVESVSTRIDRQNHKYRFIRHVEETEDVQIFP